MPKIPYTPPEVDAESFNCPYSDCRAFAAQKWGEGYYSLFQSFRRVDGLKICLCAHCNQESLWWDGHLIWPAASAAPPANPDFPRDILEDYEEAAAILARSPRGVAALLRLVIQKLCKHIGEPGRNLNDDIGALVEKGLPAEVQRALDVLRVIGNNAVHPGQIDLSDNMGIATALFSLANFIVEKMISEPAEINRLYDLLPPAALAQIQRRDEK